MTISISDRPVKLRVAGPRGQVANIEREGGQYGAGLIKGFSVITRGEALGHRLWIDDTFLEQVAKHGNRAGKLGIKARFTHPGLSGDGLGKSLGRVKNFVREDGQVRADLHISATAHETPDGDLGKYVMDLAEEDAAAFGASIVFDEDQGEMARHRAKNTDKDGVFRSPDEDNLNSFEHARLGRLWAADVVDDPAANPNGMFSIAGGELAARAEQLLQYALGLTETCPDETAAGPHPERARAFVAEFLKRHGLKMMKDTDEHGRAQTGTDADGKTGSGRGRPRSQDEEKFGALTAAVETLQSELHNLSAKHEQVKAYVLAMKGK